MKLNIQRFALSKSTSFSESNLSIENNTSSLTITAKFSPNNNVSYFAGKTLECWCNGVRKTASVSLSKGGSVTKSFTFDNIQHNNDGTKSVSWSWSCNTGISIGTVSASGTRALTTIARASAIDFNPNPVELNQATTISLTRYIEGSYDVITFKIGGTTGTIGTTDQSQYIWTPSITLASEIINSTTGVCEVTCTTYDEDDTLIGSNTGYITLEVPSSVVPSVSIGTLTEADTTMISKNWGVFVQNKSKLNIPITATGIYGSTIQSVVTTINGLNFTGTSVVTSTLVTAGTNTITTTITDSRGRTATTTATYSVEPYSNPNIQIAQVQRCLSDGTLSDNGTYLLYDFKGTISPVSNHNSASYEIAYKKTSESAYNYVSISSNYSIDLTDVISSFTISADYAYDILFSATDEFGQSRIDRELDTGFDLLSFHDSGKAMAIGKVSEAGANEELLEIALPTEFLEDITTQNIDSLDITAEDITATDITASGNISGDDISGNTGSFTSLQVNNVEIKPTWTYGGKTTGTSTANIPNGTTELYLLLRVNDSDNLVFPMYIPIMPTTTIRVNGGYSQTSAYTSRITAEITTTTIGLIYANLNNSDVLATSTMEWYYK